MADVEMPAPLDAGLGLIEDPATNAPTSVVPTATLLTLPGELRNRIYELLLLQDDEVYPYGYKPCGCDCPKRKRHAPALALLGVNRQINKEATDILYAGVNVHLSMGHQFMRFMSHGDKDPFGIRDPKKLFPSRHLIRSLSVLFLSDNMSYNHDYFLMASWQEPSFRAWSKKKRLQEIHEYHRRTCERWWACAGRVIHSMQMLKVLSLDVSQSFCPLGCCRTAGQVVQSLRRIRTKEGFEINVEGELDSEEKEMILEGLKYDSKAVEDENDEENEEERDEEQEEEHGEGEEDEGEERGEGEEDEGEDQGEGEEEGEEEQDDDFHNNGEDGGVEFSGDFLNDKDEETPSNDGNEDDAVKTEEPIVAFDPESMEMGEILSALFEMD